MKNLKREKEREVALSLRVFEKKEKEREKEKEINTVFIMGQDSYEPPYTLVKLKIYAQKMEVLRYCDSNKDRFLEVVSTIPNLFLNFCNSTDYYGVDLTDILFHVERIDFFENDFRVKNNFRKLRNMPELDISEKKTIETEYEPHSVGYSGYSILEEKEVEEIRNWNSYFSDWSELQEE